MGAGHGHGSTHSPPVAVPLASRRALLAVLLVAAVATVVGLVMLWPDGAKVDALAGRIDLAGPGVSYPHAQITRVDAGCPEDDGPVPESGLTGQTDAQAARACVTVHLRVTTGTTTGEALAVPLHGPLAAAGLGAGDSVQLIRLPSDEGGPVSYSIVGVDRAGALGWFALTFVVVVALVARVRGLLALVGLAISGAVVVRFMLPALLTGEPGMLVALVTGSAIMYVVLYLAHGVSIRTSTALAGTLGGIALTAGLAALAVQASHLSGVSDETGDLLTGYVPDLDFRSLLTGAIIIAGLGILNDVTITQSSAVWELRGAAPDMPRTEIFRSAMRIGRDHIASTIYTIVFAYTGAAMSVLLLLYLYDMPLLDLLGTEDIGTEVARTLASAIGLVLAVPLTTAIAAATVVGARHDSPDDLPTSRTRSSRHQRSWWRARRDGEPFRRAQPG